MMIVWVEDWVRGWVGATSRELTCSKHIVVRSCSTDVYACRSDPDPDCNPMGYVTLIAILIRFWHTHPEWHG